jgi:hypothetical protein
MWFSIAVPVWIVGERRLMAIIAARGAAKQEQPGQA